MIKNSNNTVKYQILFYPYDTEEEGIDLTHCYAVEADTEDEVFEAIANEKYTASEFGERVYYELYIKATAINERIA